MPNIPTFYSWLQEQYAGADTPSGDLAADTATDPGFPKDETTLEPIVAYLQGRNACRPAIEVFKDCWCEYMGTVDRIRDQAWYWTPEWQEKERRADEDIKAGRVTPPMTGDETVDFLHSLLKPEDDSK